VFTLTLSEWLIAFNQPRIAAMLLLRNSSQSTARTGNNTHFANGTIFDV
jgi:hypothetical protein